MTRLNNYILAGVTALALSGCGDSPRGTIHQMDCVDVKTLPKLTIDQLNNTVKGNIVEICSKTIPHRNAGRFGGEKVNITMLKTSEGLQFVSDIGIEELQKEPAGFVIK